MSSLTMINRVQIDQLRDGPRGKTIPINAQAQAGKAVRAPVFGEAASL
jgi:hypothetical protein